MCCITEIVFLMCCITETVFLICCITEIVFLMCCITEIVFLMCCITEIVFLMCCITEIVFLLFVLSSTVSDQLEEGEAAGGGGVWRGVHVLRCGLRGRTGGQASPAGRPECRDVKGQICIHYFTAALHEYRIAVYYLRL